MQLLRLSCALLMVCVLIVEPVEKARAEVVLQNDTFSNGQDAAVQIWARDGDILVSVFEVPCDQLPFHIKKISVPWRSQSGTEFEVIANVHFYAAGAPDPGAPLASFSTFMVDGTFAEADISSLNWIAHSSPFAIGVESAGEEDGPSHEGSGHLISDITGCSPGKNLVYSSVEQQWLEPCDAGLTGNFAIRAAGDPLTYGFDCCNGCYGDTDCDGDVDMVDFGVFQRCLSPGLAADEPCRYFDRDLDGDVDGDDFAVFESCAHGPALACDPACGRFPGPITPTVASGVLAAPRTVSLARSNSPRQFIIQLHVIRNLIIIVALLLLLSFPYNWAMRVARKTAFHASGATTNATEQANFNAALDYLRDLHDPVGDRAWLWYSNKGAYNSILRILRVSHMTDAQRQGLTATYGGGFVTVHESEVTGPNYTPQSLGLWLFAEWQHWEDSLSDNQAQPGLDAFRQRNGLVGVRPDVKHGFKEGKGAN